MMSKAFWFTTIYLFSALLHSKSMFAQDFGATGSKWHYNRPHFIDGGVDYTEIESIGDTVIDGHHCHHLQTTYGFDCAFAGKDIYLYDADGYIFYYIRELHKFKMLYNFNLQEGDTQIVYAHFLFGLDSFSFRVNNITPETINGHTLKRFSLEYLLPHQGSDDVIEGIGSMWYLYPQISICDPAPGHLRCFEDSELGLYSTGATPSCDYNRQTFEISFSPNPTLGSVAIIFQSESFSYEAMQIDFLNVLGKTLFQKTLTTERILDLSSYPSGIYFMKVKLGADERLLKLVKQ